MSLSTKLLRCLLCLLLVAAPLAHAKKERNGEGSNGSQQEDAQAGQDSRDRDRSPERRGRSQPEARRDMPAERNGEGRYKGEGRREAAPVMRQPPARDYRQAPTDMERYQPRAPRYEEAAPRMSLDQAVSQARRNSQGRVLSADTVDDDGQIVHRVKMLTPDGRVRTLYYDDQQSGYR